MDMSEDIDYSVLVNSESDQLRIDKFIVSIDHTISRTYAQKLIEEELVFVSGKPVKPSFKVSEGEQVTIHVPARKELCIEPENIPLDIIYEDEDIIIINKPKGMVVHPAAGHYNGTLVNALLYHCEGSLSEVNGAMRPGIVHRIDMDTTGLLVACKNNASHLFLAEQLKEHEITRKYESLVYGFFHEAVGTINEPIGRHPVDRKKMSVNYKNGKPAITNYHVIEAYGKEYSHIECILETGRTHQIRVHMNHINHPLLGDAVYGHAKNEFKLSGQALHAKVLGLIHPSTKQYMEFEAPAPKYFLELKDKLRGQST